MEKKYEEIVKMVEQETSNRLELKNNELFYKNSYTKIDRLALLIDFPQEEYKEKNLKPYPIVLEYGEYEHIFPYFQEHSKYPDLFNVKIIEIPIEMYRWIDILFDYSASDWSYRLLEKLKETNQEINF